MGEEEPKQAEATDLSSTADCQPLSSPFNPEVAVLAQELLSEKVQLVPLPHDPERIAATDVAYRGDTAFAVALVATFPRCEVLETSAFSILVEVPYVSGLLAFREIRPIFCAVKRLKGCFDVLLVNGHGTAHPRGFGLASHLGVLLGVPTIGVAKSPIGDPELPYNAGRLVRVKSKHWVSAGHMLQLSDAVRIVTSIYAFSREGPLEMAHRLSKEVAKLA